MTSYKSVTNFYSYSARATQSRSFTFNAETAQDFDRVLSAYKRDWGAEAFRIVTAEMASHPTDSDRIRAARAGVAPGKYWDAWRKTLNEITYICERLEYPLDEPPSGAK